MDKQVCHSFNRESSENLFNLCYGFYIVFVKYIKSFIVSHIIVQMDLPVDRVCIDSPKQDSFKLVDWLQNMINLPLRWLYYFAVDGTICWIWHEECQVHRRCHYNHIRQLGDAKSKWISSLSDKLNRNRVCMSNNRIILSWEQINYWTFTSSRIRE